MRWGEDDGVYEVFVQLGTGRPIECAGSVRAADPELAWHAAKEAYTRRDRCSLLWVVRRTAIMMSDEADSETLLSGQRMEFRRPGYPGRHRRERTERLARGQQTAASPPEPFS